MLRVAAAAAAVVVVVLFRISCLFEPSMLCTKPKSNQRAVVSTFALTKTSHQSQPSTSYSCGDWEYLRLRKLAVCRVLL